MNSNIQRNKVKDQNKFNLGTMKLMVSATPAHPNPNVIPKDKRKSEFAVTLIFAQLLMANGYSVTKIELNENDENKGADSIVKVNGNVKGIQITKLVLNEILTRRNVSIKKSLDIAKIITENLDIDFKLNVMIYPPNLNRNEMPPNKPKLIKKLAEEIKKSIKLNLDNLKTSPDAIFVELENDSLDKMASIITLNPIPKGLYSVFPGIKNIFVNYEFDNNFFNYEDAKNEIDLIFQRKNNGKADYLLIWADVFDLIYKQDVFFNLIQKKFEYSSFEEIFFLTFFDRKDLFNKSIQIKKVKNPISSKYPK